MDADRQLTSSLTFHRSWKISSARLRVLQKTIVVLVRLDLRHHLLGGIAARMARPGDAALGQQDRDVRVGAGLALRPASTASISPSGASQAR